MAGRPYSRHGLLVAALFAGLLCASAWEFPSWMHKTEDIWATQRDIATRCGGIMTMKDVPDATTPDAKLPVINFKTKVDKPKTKVFFTFNIHARELISGEIGLNLVKTICDEKTGKNASPKINFPDDVELVMIPILNPNGRKLVEGGNECQRKNGNNVDINRNFDVDFGGESKEEGNSSEEFEGNKPFSEPEARIARDVAASFGPGIKLYIDIHSGANTMMYPWAFKSDAPPATDKARWEAFANAIKGEVAPRIGEASHTIGYTATGVTMDYFYAGSGGDAKGKAPNSYTFETYDSGAYDSAEMSASGAVELLQEGETDTGCFLIFNPPSATELTTHVGKWTTVMMNAIQKAPAIDTMGVSATDATTTGAAVSAAATPVQPAVAPTESSDNSSDAAQNGGEDDDDESDDEDDESTDADGKNGDESNDDGSDDNNNESMADADAAANKQFKEEEESMDEDPSVPSQPPKHQASAAAMMTQMQDNESGADDSDQAEVPTVTADDNNGDDDDDDSSDDSGDDASSSDDDDSSDDDASGSDDDTSLLQEDDADMGATDDTYSGAVGLRANMRRI